MDIRSSTWIQMGFPRGEGGRSEIRLRETRQVIGFVREELATATTVRYFAEDATGFPIEGTFKTKSDAALAVARNAGVPL